jgi:hypothetical protein
VNSSILVNFIGGARDTQSILLSEHELVKQVTASAFVVEKMCLRFCYVGSYGFK